MASSCDGKNTHNTHSLQYNHIGICRSEVNNSEKCIPYRSNVKYSLYVNVVLFYNKSLKVSFNIEMMGSNVPGSTIYSTEICTQSTALSMIFMVLVPVEFIHIPQGVTTEIETVVWFPQRQWCNLEGNGKINLNLKFKYDKARLMCVIPRSYCIWTNEK